MSTKPKTKSVSNPPKPSNPAPKVGGTIKSATNSTTFYAEVTKGYIVKVIVDILCGGSLQRGVFKITSKGLSLRQSDQGDTILYDIDLPRKHFKNYKCTKPKTISVNLKHMQGLLRNVKKKDSVAMSIDTGAPGKFTIIIRPEGAREGTRAESNSIAYQEEKDYESIKIPHLGAYKHPKVITNTDFQKIKRLTTIGKIITINIQRGNYISFECDAGSVYASKIEFGSIEAGDEADGEDGEDGEAEDDGEVEDVDDGEDDDNGEAEVDDGEVEDEDDGEAEDEDEEAEGGNGEGLFQAQYHSSILSKLVKLPGLCALIGFYSPTSSFPGYPLCIEANAGQGGYILGTIRVFIKDVNQITYEASMNNDVLTTTSKSKKTKK